MGSLFTPLNTIEETKPTTSIVGFLNIIEGWKTRIKNLHWSAPKMNTHKVLDEIADFVSSYQDSLAEDYMGIEGKLQPNILKGKECDVLNAKDLMNCMKDCTLNFYNSLPSDTIYVGIKSETETFIHNINKYIYLVNLCDVSVY